MIRIIKNIMDKVGLGRYEDKQLIDYFLVGMAFILGLHMAWSISRSIIFAFVIWLILNPISSVRLAKISIFFLLGTLLLLLDGSVPMADKSATLFYAFIVLALAEYILEILRQKKRISVSK